MVYTLGSPSPPVNLSYVETSSAADNFTVRLEWEAPLDDGGAAIASYQVSVDMSLAAVVSTDTTTILTLNSTGEYDVEIRAANTCNNISEAAVTRIVVIGGCIYGNDFAWENWPKALAYK